MSKIVLGLLATSIGLGVLSLHLVNEVRSGKATIEELQAQVAELKKPVHRAPAAPPAEQGTQWIVVPDQPQAAAAPRNEIPERPVALVTTNGDPPKEGGDRNWRRDRSRQFREQQRELLKDPEYRAAMLVQHRTGIAQYYKDVGLELGLDAEKSEALLDLLAEQQVRRMEQPPMFSEPGQAPDPVEAQRNQQRYEAMERKNQEEVGALLGADKAQAFKDYQANSGARQTIQQMRDTLASQGMPLTDDNARAMVQAVAESQRQMHIEVQPTASAFSPNASPGDRVEMMQRQMEFIQENQKRTLEAMSPYLTTSQRRVVEQQQSAQRKRQEAQLRLMIKQQEAMARSGEDDHA